MLLMDQQNERILKGSMLSDMGDGSTDHKTIEQEIRYPTSAPPPSHPTHPKTCCPTHPPPSQWRAVAVTTP